MAGDILAAIAPARQQLVSTCWAHDEPVCALPDWQTRGLPRFGDDRWDFRGHPSAIDKANEQGWKYDWTVISNPMYALAMREFAMGRMNRPHRLPAVTRLLWPPSTTIMYLRALEPFFTWLEARCPGTPLGAVGQDDLDLYAKTVLTGRGGHSSKTARLRAVQTFFAYFWVAATSDHPDDRLDLSFASELLPWRGKPVSEDPRPRAAGPEPHAPRPARGHGPAAALGTVLYRGCIRRHLGRPPGAAVLPLRCRL